ncbi:Planctomycete cytochrome C [Allorhodopirellula heiligendammensis]|uniref:Planctomycete cytochrome C n=2 Tax=Allorhodopirellula heiligendammensis TaxID=2714739 RepID=A0A5C6BUL1_9BACT|nr:Planctomycete cytochrome C [Allorhodopirellula heiligendammensis]
MRLCLLVGIVIASVSTADESEAIHFNEDIRPILSENCFECHGPDEDTRAADLRLDRFEDAVDYGAIVPGEPEESVLVERILTEDADMVMPPPHSHKSLNEAQKKLLVQWIQAGATYQRHWSFEPIPTPRDASKTIDDFIDDAIARKQLKLSPPAPPERWLRRVTLDLTGLPPTLAEIDAFLADDSNSARERVVDRLLASSAYAERMAAEWLDVARYSDTYGYQVDRDRFVWPWRDWVIKAFDHNMPYDEFITEQLAGDLLPNATDDQILATTFNRLHPQKVEGGSVEEEFRVEYVIDRAQTVSTAFMGLTFECARCHDHKFDPLTQKEFYELNAFFANINEAGLYSYHTNSIPTPTLRLPTDEQRQQLADADRLVAAAAKNYSDKMAEVELDTAMTAGNSGNKVSLTPIVSQSFDDDAAKKLPVEFVEGVQGQAGRLSGDAGVSVGPADFRRWQPFSVSLWLQTPDVKDRAVVFHHSLGWTDAASRGYQLLIEDGKLSAALVHYWPGNAINVRTLADVPVDQWQHVVMTYDGSSRAAGLQIFINGKLAECEIVEDSLTKDITTGNTHNITIGERTRDRGFTNGVVDEFEVFDRRLTGVEVAERFHHRSLDELCQTETMSSLPPADRREVVTAYFNEDCQKAFTELTAARETQDRLLDAIAEIMVMRELPEPRDTFVLGRGVYDQHQERVTAATPATLPPMDDDEPRNRLGLAHWLTRDDHPLTARVAVNRYWQLLFGRGLVKTTEDFGNQGTPPSHPELLDWLARGFIDSGWNVKGLLKTMVLSQAYQRDSDAVGDSRERDPENIWLARGPIAPLTAEMIRDSALAGSGLLSAKIGGPPARPYELAVAFKPVTPDHGEGLYRRSLYTYWKRTSPAPVMLVLDASTRDVCSVRRERTSSPLQAMVLLNGPQYVEAAQGAAAQVVEELGPDAAPEKRVTRLFQLLTSRTPTRLEASILTRLYHEQMQVFSDDKNAVGEYLGIGEFDAAEATDKLSVATLSIVAQAIMNLDDCLIKR